MSLWLPDDDLKTERPDELKSAINRYRRLLDGDGHAFWEWNIRDNTYICAGNFWKKLGYHSIENVILSVDESQEYIHPDDFGFVSKTYKQHVIDNKPINIIYRIRRANDTYCWTQVSASSTRDASGNVNYITGIIFDLSNLKDTEKALRLSQARHERVLRSSNDGIWEWSATDANNDPVRAGFEGRFHTSYSFWKHLGYSEEEVDSLPQNERMSVWKSHIHPHDFDHMRANLAHHFATREPLSLEYRMFGEKGKMFWMRTRGDSVFNNHGRSILISGININITELKEAQEQAYKAKEEAERANRSKSNFLSSMSHELRTPLNSILGFSRLLATDNSLDQQHHESAKYIHDAGQHLLTLINDVLDLAQIEAGKMSFQKQLILPEAIIKNSFTYCKNMAKDKNITFHFDHRNLNNRYISVDPVRFRQCVLNLMSNAVKYNVNGGKVMVTLSDKNGDLEIIVSDTGLGIPKEKQKSLFEMFNRLGAERSSVEGSGLGLVLTKQLVTAMGGVLMYCDQSAPGASFKMLFPIETDSAEPKTEVNDDEIISSQEISLDFTESKKVFYIEDNESNIRFMSSLMEPCQQLLMLSESDPFVGLYAIRSDLPDIVLLDINLPGINGYEILSVLKNDPATKHLPVVAISASAMTQDVERGLEQGFDAYLTKPVDIDKLSAVLNNVFVSH